MLKVKDIEHEGYHILKVIPKQLVCYLNKSGMLEYLSNKGREKVTARMTVATLSDLLYKKLQFKTYQKSFFQYVTNSGAKYCAVNGSTVDKLLGTNLTKRKRLVEGGYLKVTLTDTVTLYGRMVEVSSYDCVSVAVLLRHKDELVDILKSIKRTPTKQELANRKVRKLKQQELAKLRDDFYQGVTAQEQKWAHESSELDLAIRKLGFWTMQMNHLAKYCELNPQHKCKVNPYELKGLALDLLWKCKTAKLTALISGGYYQPQNADRTHVTLCFSHLQDYDEFNYLHPYPAGGFLNYYNSNQKEIDSCKECEVTKDTNYYALYYLAVADTFKFHEPYNLGYPVFGDPDKLPRLHHKPNESGHFKFGTAMTNDELRVIGEQKLIDNWDKCYSSLLLKYNQLTD